MTFASSVVQSLGISKDVIAKFREKYKSKKDAESIIKKAGGMRKFACEVFSDFPQLNLHSAKRGDVVLIDHKGNEVMGVCVGAEAAVLGSDGIELLSIMDHGKIVWGIGHK